MRTVGWLSALVALVVALSCSACASVPRSGSAGSLTESSSSVAEGWQPAQAKLGISILLPPNWAMRADTPDFLAVWPDWTGGQFDPDTQLDGVQIQLVDHFQSRADFDPKLGALQNGMAAFGAEQLAVSAIGTGTVLGEPCQVVAGRKGTLMALLMVSKSYVVRANIFADAPRAGETTEYVMGFLRSVGFAGQVPPAR